MKTGIRDEGATLALLGRVEVLGVGVVGLNPGLTVYRERKHRKANKQTYMFHTLLCNAIKDDGMTRLNGTIIVLNIIETI